MNVVYLMIGVHWVPTLSLTWLLDHSTSMVRAARSGSTNIVLSHWLLTILNWIVLTRVDRSTARVTLLLLSAVTPWHLLAVLVARGFLKRLSLLVVD